MSFDQNIERRQPQENEDEITIEDVIKAKEALMKSEKRLTKEDWARWREYKSNKDLITEAWERQEEEE